MVVFRFPGRVNRLQPCIRPRMQRSCIGPSSGVARRKPLDAGTRMSRCPCTVGDGNLEQGLGQSTAIVTAGMGGLLPVRHSGGLAMSKVLGRAEPIPLSEADGRAV
jgi:hypothetical protein